MSQPPETRLEEFFAAALEVAPEGRDSFLEEACAGDAQLRRELDELVAAHGDAEGFLDDLAESIAEDAALELETAARPKIRLGAYRADEAIGRGGMGVVYRATRVDGEFEHQVALKLLHLDMQTPAMSARFLAERQILARLQHPNIARLLDGGVSDEGRPYFVMELIDGRPITEYCRQEGLSLAETSSLFLQVVEAVKYLHRNLVIHRDLKPSNLLVQRDGVVKLLDFGVAKLVADDHGAATVTGERLLTPQYAAPEQLTGGAITTATDIYGLGVVFYELLAGRRPHDRTSLDRLAAQDEIATPPRIAPPSEALRSERAVSPSPDPPEGTAQPSNAPRWRRVPRDLDNVCLMALRSEPERRYASAEQLGGDIERQLAGLPVIASPDALGYRLGKFLRRHWRGAVAATALVALLGFGLVRERTLRDAAEEAALKAEAVSGFLGDLFSSADPAQAQGSEVTVTEVLKRAEEKLVEGAPFAGRPAVESEVRLVLGQTYRALGRVADARAQFEEALRLAGGLSSDAPAAMAAAKSLANTGSLDPGRREALLTRVVEVWEATLGPDHQDTLSALNSMAAVMLGQGRHAAAEVLDRRVLEARRRVLGPEHPNTMVAVYNLAADLFATARYTEAAELYQGALAISRRHNGPSHPHTLGFMANLGATYGKLGRYGEAETLQREAVAEQLRVLGDRHERTGMSMHNLGSTLHTLGKLVEAESWFRRAVEARAEGSPAGYLYSKSYLADTVRDLGRLEDAEELYRDTLSSQRRSLEPGHADTFRTEAALAELYRVRGDLGAADELASRVLTGQLELSGEKRLDAADTHELLARVRAAQGRFEEAIEHLDRARAVREEVFSEDHPVMLASRLERAKVLAAAGKTDAARATLEGLATALASSFGPDHLMTGEARDLLETLRDGEGVDGE